MCSDICLVMYVDTCSVINLPFVPILFCVLTLALFYSSITSEECSDMCFDLRDTVYLLCGPCAFQVGECIIVFQPYLY